MSKVIKIGNIAGASNRALVTIKDAETLDGIFQVVMKEDAVMKNEIMGEHSLNFSFDYPRSIQLHRGDYVKYEQLKFALRKDYNPEEIENGGGYRYTLKFEAPRMFFQDVYNCYRLQGIPEFEWSLFASADRFMQIGIDNLNAELNQGWKLGVVEPTEQLHITFSKQYVFDSFTAIAEQFKCEWHVDDKGKTINIVRRLSRGKYVPLRKGELLSSIQKDITDKGYFTRLYVNGSSRNLPPNYRKPIIGEAVEAIVQHKLKLPVETGGYIDVRPNLKRHEIVPKIVDFDVFPQRIGTVTNVREIEKRGEDGKMFKIFYIKDADLKFKKEYILAGETLMLQFGENSWLNGRDFEVLYNEREEEYEIQNIQEGDNLVPNALLKPKVGDFYTLYNFNIALVGDQYVGEAEKELERVAREYIADVEPPMYRCLFNKVLVAQHNIATFLGQNIRLIHPIIPNGEVKSRIYGYERYLITREDRYSIGDNSKYSRFNSIEEKVETNKKVVDVQMAEAMKIANGAVKSIKGLNYLRTSLENETTIDKGLLLTTLIRLGAMRGVDWKEVAGINGSAIEEEDVVAYFGGTLDEAIEGVASIVFKLDGSGHLAKGNISWDALGNLMMLGKFESNKDGDKIIIDPETRSIKMVSEKGYEVMTITFEKEENDWVSPSIKLNHYNNGEISSTADITGYQVKVEDSVGNVAYLQPTSVGLFNKEDVNAPSFHASSSIDKNGNAILNADFNGLPTSKTEVAVSGLYTARITQGEDSHKVICKK